jgi:DNA-binding NarL/FixJ family response regulator
MAEKPHLRLIVLSAHDGGTVATLIRNTGAAGFVLKRTTATDLLPAIQEVLRGGPYVSPSLGPPPDDSGVNTKPEPVKPEA